LFLIPSPYGCPAPCFPPPGPCNLPPVLAKVPACGC